METDAPELVLLQVNDGVAQLTLNRPKRRNALSSALTEALISALQVVAQDPAVRSVVLTGAGDKAFCAGGDLSGSFAPDGALAAWRQRGRFGEALLAIHRLNKPVVAAVQGDALGGGFGLALACDMMVVGEGVRLGTPEIKVGLFPMIILAELVRNVPRKLLSELIYTGRRVSSEEAVQWGLANRAVPRDQVLASATELAQKVASFSPAVVGLGKQALQLVDGVALEPAIALLHGRLEANLITEDAMEGIGAFLQRREPDWKGR